MFDGILVVANNITANLIMLIVVAIDRLYTSRLHLSIAAVHAEPITLWVAKIADPSCSLAGMETIVCKVLACRKSEDCHVLCFELFITAT